MKKYIKFHIILFYCLFKIYQFRRRNYYDIKTNKHYNCYISSTPSYLRILLSIQGFSYVFLFFILLPPVFLAIEICIRNMEDPSQFMYNIDP